MDKLLKSKTFWAGVAGVFSAVGLYANGETAEAVTVFFTSVTAIFLRDGMNKNE